jgi:hypothetical protein
VIFNLNTKIDKIGPNLFVGYKQHIPGNFFFDVYAGVGLRYSFNDADSEDRTYSDHMFSYGYTGTSPLIGLRIGKSF